MKRTLQIAVIVSLGLLQLQTIVAQLTPKNLTTLVYNGVDNPTNSGFLQLSTIKDSFIYTQTANGYNILTKAAQWVPVTWYATSDQGFAANGAFTVEAKVAVQKSMKNGFQIEVEGVPGKRFKIDIDTAAVYNMTYYPSTSKEVIVNNLDNKGMHTYRIAVDNTDKAHVYRDGVKIGTADADGMVSSTAYYKDIEVLMEDKFFEDFIESVNTAFPSPLKYPTHETFKGAVANFDITYSNWAVMGIDTAKANVKVGKTSMWFNNGTTGELKILKTGLTAGKYKISYWSKTKAAGEAYKGSIKMVASNVVIFPVTTMVPDNRNFNYREFAFDVPEDGDILITFHNGWSNTQKPGWANIWFDDLRIAKVQPVPYLRFGKDNEAGIAEFTLGSVAYDLTGAYSPSTSGISQNNLLVNDIYTTSSDGMLNVTYSLANNSKTDIQLIDLSGRVLSHQNVMSNAGVNTTTFATNGMKGVYLLRFLSNDTAKTVKVEVK